MPEHATTWVCDHVKVYLSRHSGSAKWGAYWGHANLHRVHVQLGKKDQKQIGGILNKGRESARVLRRVLILRELDEGQTAAQMASHLGVAPKTVRAIARRYEEEGLKRLRMRAAPGPAAGAGAGQSQRIIAMVCSPPPEGRARWSVRLIAQEAVKWRLAPKVGRETIRILFTNHELKPWRGKKLVRGGTG